jgi:hypothetical protein
MIQEHKISSLQDEKQNLEMELLLCNKKNSAKAFELEWSEFFAKELNKEEVDETSVDDDANGTFVGSF